MPLEPFAAGEPKPRKTSYRVAWLLYSLALIPIAIGGIRALLAGDFLMAGFALLALAFISQQLHR